MNTKQEQGRSTTFTIKHRRSGDGLWTCEADSLKKAVEAVNGTARVTGIEEGPDFINTRQVRAAVIHADDGRCVLMTLDNGYWCWDTRSMPCSKKTPRR